MRRKKAMIVCGAVGQASEPWLWRQIVGMRTVDVSVLCWRVVNREMYPLENITTHVLEHPAQPMYGFGRWWIRLRNLGTGNFYGAVGDEKRDIQRLIAMERPDVLLCHFGHYALRLLPVALENGIPLVAHFHGLDLSSALVQDRWYRASLLKCLPLFSGFVVVGEHQRRWLLEHGVRSELISLIPCGAPMDGEQAITRSEPGKVRYINVSRLVEWKGVDITLTAFARVSSVLPEAELLIVGDGPEKDKLVQLAEALKLKDRVVFAGVRSSAEVVEHYRSSDVFVQHSVRHSNGWVEGFGVTIVEAAAMKLPVVVSRSGGIGPQVVHGETGYLVEERDVEAMAEGMLKLGSDAELRRQMGERGRAHVEKNFDVTNQIAALERVLSRVAGEGSSAGEQSEDEYDDEDAVKSGVR